MCAEAQQREMIAGMTHDHCVPSLSLHGSIIIPDHQPFAVGNLGQRIVVFVQIHIAQPIKSHGSICNGFGIQPWLDCAVEVASANVIVFVKRKHQLQFFRTVG